MSQLLRSMEVLRHQLGVLGMLGLLGLFGCVLMGLISLMPAEQTLQQKTQELALLRQQPIGNVEGQTPKLNDGQALEKFYQQFPPVSDLSKILAQIHQLALDKGIHLVVGEYKMAPDVNNPRLMRYAIVFPVQSNYKNLHNFIASASEKFPTLGLSEVSLKRDSVKEAAVQIKLSYVLFLSRMP